MSIFRIFDNKSPDMASIKIMVVGMIDNAVVKFKADTIDEISTLKFRNAKLENELKNNHETINNITNELEATKKNLYKELKIIQTNFEIVEKKMEILTTMRKDIAGDKLLNEKKYVKKKIPIAIKSCVWDKWIGLAIGSAPCPIGCGHTITQNSFHCGHIIAEAKGGETSVANMRPICEQCNKSMGTMDMNDFIKKFASQPEDKPKKCGKDAKYLTNNKFYCETHAPNAIKNVPDKCESKLKNGKNCNNTAIKSFDKKFYCGTHCKDSLAKNIECCNEQLSDWAMS